MVFLLVFWSELYGMVQYPLTYGRLARRWFACPACRWTSFGHRWPDRVQQGTARAWGTGVYGWTMVYPGVYGQCTAPEGYQGTIYPSRGWQVDHRTVGGPPSELVVEGPWDSIFWSDALARAPKGCSTPTGTPATKPRSVKVPITHGPTNLADRSQSVRIDSVYEG